jgi:hypothetical protein
MCLFFKYLYFCILTVSLSIIVADYYIDTFDCPFEQTTTCESSNHIEKSHGENLEHEVFYEGPIANLVIPFSKIDFNNSGYTQIPNSFTASIWQPPKLL